MKYIIELPDEFAEATKEYWDKTVGLQLETYTESDRKAIENEVWELADYVVRMGAQERDLCFGFKFTTEVTANLSYQEAKARFEAWLEQKEDESVNEFLVGDEVIDLKGIDSGVVTKVYGYGGYLSIVDKYGFCGDKYDAKNFRKTGRHFPEVSELLEKIKEEK